MRGKVLLGAVLCWLVVAVWVPAVGLRAASGSGTEFCPPLPPATGTVVDVNSVAALVDAVNDATAGTTIRIADGTYDLHGAALWIDTPNVTLRSASGERDAVVLDGNYETTEIVTVTASDVTIADLTLRRAFTHPIHVVSAEGTHTRNTRIYNVRIIDPREQAIKINPGAAGYYADDGLVACSHIELTDAGRPHVNPTAGGCYTGGVDAHAAQGWVIRDNIIAGFWCDSGLSEHAVHMWRGCRDTVVERNVLRDNARGVGLGLSPDGSARTYPDDPCPGAPAGQVEHYGGVVRNNAIFAGDADLFASDSGFDCGICLWQACGAWVGHNTVAATAAPFSSIEWRYADTDVDLVNNLATHAMRDRGGTARLAGNRDEVALALFVDGAGGDLHLAPDAAAAIDQGVAVAAGRCDDDIDGDPRPIGAARDVGADEYGTSAPAAVTDLRIAEAVTEGGTLTATLAWTPPTAGVTASLRYASALITEATWASAEVLSDTLPGTAGSFIAVVPYEGGTHYIAHRAANAGGWSALSNVVFWPVRTLYLPVVLRDA